MAVRHAILPKGTALNGRGITADWPGCGLPDALHTDSGSDFRSDAFMRACANFGIASNLSIGLRTGTAIGATRGSPV